MKALGWGWFPESPSLSFSTMVDYAEHDSDVCDAGRMWTEAVVGVGHYTTVNEGYEDVKEYVDDKMEELNLDNKLYDGVQNILLFGNEFWERVYRGDRLVNVVPLPLTSFDGPNFVIRSDQGEILGYKQTTKPHRFEPWEIIHWKWGGYDQDPGGQGLLHALCQRRTVTFLKKGGTQETLTIPSVMETKWMMERDIRNIIHYLPGKSVWYLKDVEDEAAETLTGLIDELAPGERIVTNQGEGITITTEAPMPAQLRGIEPFFDWYQNIFIRGLRVPHHRLFSRPGYTEASANVVEELWDRGVFAVQRYVKRIIESEIYKPLVISEFNPLRWRKSGLRLNWGIPEVPDFNVKHVIDLAKLGTSYITPQEVRAILREQGWKLEEETPVEEEGPTAKEPTEPLEEELAEIARQMEEWRRSR